MLDSGDSPHIEGNNIKRISTIIRRPPDLFIITGSFGEAGSCSSHRQLLRKQATTLVHTVCCAASDYDESTNTQTFLIGDEDRFNEDAISPVRLPHARFQLRDSLAYSQRFTFCLSSP